MSTNNFCRAARHYGPTICTLRFTNRLRAIGLALGAQAGQRLAKVFSLPTSADTILRVIRQTPLPVMDTPKVLGVDDWAMRRGRTYGTILVDLEQRRPIDLLPDRTAETLAQWLKTHPGVEIISRDRSVEYTLGANMSAPRALQVADRWHLLKNLREALERALTRLSSQLTQIPAAPSIPTLTTALRPRRLRPPSESELLQQRESRAVRYRRYQAIRLLLARGLSERTISRLLNLTRTTVHKYATSEGFPERAVLRPAASKLDPYLPYLQHRVQAGITNASQLWREVKAQGYSGAYRQVSRVVRYYRHQATQSPAPIPSPHLVPPLSPVVLGPLPSARQLVWLLLRPTEDLTSDEQALFSLIRQHPPVETAYQLTRQFQSMLRLRQADRLQGWLNACRASPLPDLQTFATALQREFPSIYAALAGPWSNGPVEGHVNRLKLIKRTMFGRAKFDLLRIRVLAVPA